MTIGESLERRIGLERVLVRIRWFGVVFGVFQITEYHSADLHPPAWTRPAAYAAVGAFAALNLALAVLLRRPPGERRLRRIGATAFACDLAVLTAITWIYSFEKYGATWIILYIGPMEGALRYQMRGAMAPLLLALVTEPVRDLVSSNIYGYPFVPGNVSFRLGIMTVIAWTAGAMSARLARESAQAKQLADREAALHRELRAFHDVLLAGVSTAGLGEALQSMVERIGRDFGYASLTVLLMETDGRLLPAASYGSPHLLSRALAPGEGIPGEVAATGRPLLVPDVSADPRSAQGDPATLSELGVPIVAGSQVAGVLSAGSRAPDAFGNSDTVRLERIAAYMSLVIENARLLSQERATIDRLRELDTMKSDFVAITSHELRTPLTAMRGFIKTLRRPDLTVGEDELNEFLAILDRQSDRLARLVEDLLIVSRIDAGALHLRMEPVDVEECFRETLHELGPSAASVALHVTPGLARIVTDSQRLGQITRNLLENALKFSPVESGVRLSACRDADHLVIEVADKGPGIPAEDITRVFERFHQVGGSLRRRADGFGLGLYITKRLVEVLGGTVGVESEVGAGTTFRVRLPLAPVASPPAGQSPIRASTNPSGSNGARS